MRVFGTLRSDNFDYRQVDSMEHINHLKVFKHLHVAYMKRSK